MGAGRAGISKALKGQCICGKWLPCHKVIDTMIHMPERTAGESKWSTHALIKYALTNISAFSSLPMQAVTVLGCVSLVFSIALGVYTLFRYFAGTAVTGFTTVILLLLFSSSIIMLSLGLIGLYIAKIYEECKGRTEVYHFSDMRRKYLYNAMSI